ncbi:hypothetical protein D3C78_1815680 [compost metagenome]
MTAADGFVETVGADHHLRSGIARGGAALLDDGHQHAGLAALLQVGKGVYPAHVVNLGFFAGMARSYGSA